MGVDINGKVSQNVLGNVVLGNVQCKSVVVNRTYLCPKIFGLQISIASYRLITGCVSFDICDGELISRIRSGNTNVIARNILYFTRILRTH